MIMGKYRYGNASNASVGMMRCERCGKKITNGLFRYWESRSGEAYLSEHKDCSLQDPEWTRLEELESYRKEHEKNLLIAALEFKDTWNVDDLDNLIEELTHD